MLAGVVCLAVASLSAGAEAAPRRDVSYYHYSLSRQALARHDFSGAIAEMERAVEADPGSLELTLDLARLHLDLGDPAKAAEAARRGSALDPKAAEPARILAEALVTAALREGAGNADFTAARESLQDLQRLDPQDPQAPFELARLLVAGGRHEEALIPLGRHLELKPGSEEGALLASQALGKLRRFDQARDILLDSIRVNPARPRLRVALIETYEGQGRLADAADVAKGLLQAGFEPMRVRFALARLSQRMGDHDAAYDHLAALSALMGARPAEFSAADRAEIEVRMAGALLAAGRLDDAIAFAEEARVRYPEDDRFLVRKGEALILDGRSKEAEALVGTERSSEIYLAAGARRERAGKLDEAERLLRRSIDLDPVNAAALNYLGFMLAEQGRQLDEAVSFVQRALQKEPENGAYLDSLGWVFFKKGDFGKAEDYLVKASRASEDEPEIHEHLGELYFATGRVREAMESWQKALDLGPEDPERVRARMVEARGEKGAPD